MRANVKGQCLTALLLGVVSLTSSAMAVESIQSVRPNLSDTTGLEVVEIRGSAGVDWTNATGVNFGTTPGTDFRIVNATTVQVTTPPHAKGCVDVTIVDPDVADALTLTDGLVFTTHNRVLQVSVRMTVGRNATLAWGGGTDSSDLSTAVKGGAAHAVDTIEAFSWYVFDCEFGMPAVGNPAKVALDETYSTDGRGAFLAADRDNRKVLILKATSKTQSAVRIDAIGSDASVTVAGATPWILANATGVVDEFSMRAGARLLHALVTNVEYTDATSTVEVTTAAAHGFAGGENITISLDPPDSRFDGNATVVAVTANTFTYTLGAALGADVAVFATSGTVESQAAVVPASLSSAAAVPVFASTATPYLASLRLEVTTPDTQTTDINLPAFANVEQRVTVSLIATAP